MAEISVDSVNPILSSPFNIQAGLSSPPSHRHSKEVDFQVLQDKTQEEGENVNVKLNEKNNIAQEYFQQDPQAEQDQENEEGMRKMLQNEKEKIAYDVKFKPKVFVKFAILHLLFYCGLGPFIIILAPIFGWRLLYNLRFIGFSWVTLLQTLECLVTVSFFVIINVTKTSGLQGTEGYMIVINILIRILTVSSKYAYQTDWFLKVFHKVALSETDVRKDTLLNRWVIQTDDIIDEEIKSAILRLEIDSPLFFFEFLGKVSPDLKTKLAKNQKTEINLVAAHRGSGEEEKIASPRSDGETLEIKSEKLSKKSTKYQKLIKKFKSKKPRVAQVLYSNHLSDLTNFHHHKTGSFSGYNLAFDLIKSCKANRFKHLSLLVLLVSVFRALIPTLYRLFLVRLGFNIPVLTDKPYIVIGVILQNVMAFWLNIFLLSISIQDTGSKILCFKQISYIISPKRLHYFEEKKLYPTLNIFDPITLKTWSNLRKLVKDYGKKYILRNNYNITISMIFYAYILAMFIIQLVQFSGAQSDLLLLFILGFESLIFLIMFVNMLFGAAFLNSQYKILKNLLKKNKTIISDFLRLSRYYVGKDAVIPENLIYKEGLRLLKKELGDDDNFEEKLMQRAENLIGIIDDMIEELEFEEENEPFTVLGLPVTYGVIKTIFAGVLSGLFALFQKFVV